MNEQQTPYTEAPYGAPPSPGPVPPPYGAPQNSAPYQQKPDNYLIWAILVTACCCVPFGIIAIINSLRVDDAWNYDHNYALALQHSQKARKWCIWGALTSIIGTVVVVLIYAIAIMVGMGVALTT